MIGICWLVAVATIGVVDGSRYDDILIERIKEFYECGVVKIDDDFQRKVATSVRQGLKVPVELLEEFDLVTASKILADGRMVPCGAWRRGGGHETFPYHPKESVKQGNLATAQNLPAQYISNAADESIKAIWQFLQGKSPRSISAAVATVVYDADPPFVYVFGMFRIRV